MADLKKRQVNRQESENLKRTGSEESKGSEGSTFNVSNPFGTNGKKVIGLGGKRRSRQNKKSRKSRKNNKKSRKSRRN